MIINCCQNKKKKEKVVKLIPLNNRDIEKYDFEIQISTMDGNIMTLRVPYKSLASVSPVFHNAAINKNMVGDDLINHLSKLANALASFYSEFGVHVLVNYAAVE